MSVKEEVMRAIERLPDDATVEDAIERLYLLFKVQRARAAGFRAGHYPGGSACADDSLAQVIWSPALEVQRRSA